MGLFLLRVFRESDCFLSEKGKRPQPLVNMGVRVRDAHLCQKPRFQLPVTLEVNQTTHPLSALVDSGSEQKLIELHFAQSIGIPLVCVETPIPVQALNNQMFTQINQHSETVVLVTQGNHRERIVFLCTTLT